MAIKLENTSGAKVPRNLQTQVENIFKVLPREHIRGIDRIKLVETIKEPQLRTLQNVQLPGLYHPRQAAKPAWIEISTDILMGPTESFQKRMMLRLSFKSNLATIIFSLVGQHYYSTLRHSVKRGQMESAVRSYTEKHLRIWNRNEHKLRTRLFKPLEPHLERWAKKLRRNAAKERAKAQRLSP
jgi:hypothetical protein